MNNVNNWRKSSIKYLNENKGIVEDPDQANGDKQIEHNDKMFAQQQERKKHTSEANPTKIAESVISDYVSLPRSISLSNNRSRESFGNNPLGTLDVNQNQPFQFIPIVLMACPSVVKGQSCKCGFDSCYAINDFYKTQMQPLIKNRNQEASGSGIGDDNGSGSGPSQNINSGGSW